MCGVSILIVEPNPKVTAGVENCHVPGSHQLIIYILFVYTQRIILVRFSLRNNFQQCGFSVFRDNAIGQKSKQYI